ncbi:hypothetical protein Tco_0658088 [Tanacetum coccineum]
MRGKVDLTRILDLIFHPTPVNDAMGEVCLLSFFINAGPVEIGGEWQSLVDLPLNESRSSQRSGLGSGIPSLVGAFGSKVIKCGAGSSLSTSSASREGDRGDPDFRSLLYGGRIPIICSLSGEGDKGEGPNMFYPQPPSVISNLNSLFLFTSTMRATTSSPLLVREKASAQGLMKSQQLVRTRGAHSLPLNDEAGSGRRDLNPQPQPWQGYALPIKLFPPATLHESARNQLIPEPFVLFHSRAISFLSVGLCHPLEQVREPRVNELKEPHDRIVHRLCIWMCIKKGRGRGREREEAAAAPHELLTGALREKLPPRKPLVSFLDMLSPVDVTDQPHASSSFAQHLLPIVSLFS